jgi:hypothetical protein
MGTVRNTLDHGAALRVPPAHDAKGWLILMKWLGDAGRLAGQGLVEVTTPAGAWVATPGDWIVLSVNGSYHVTRPR